MTIDAGSIFLSITIVINLLLAVVVLIKVEKRASTIFFILFLFSTFLWGVPLLIYGFIKDVDISLLMSRIAYFAAGAASIALLNFSAYFSSGGIKDIYKKILKLASIAILVFLFLGILTNIIIEGFESFDPLIPTDRILQFGPLYSIYSVVLLAGFVLSFLVLYIQYRKEKVDQKIKQLQYMFIGILTTVTLGIITNLVLPSFGDLDYYWLGPIFTSVMSVFITIAIVRTNLLNVKVIATELLVMVLWVAIFTRTILSLSSNNITDTVYNSVLLILSVFLGILLMRSVMKEVRTRERLAVANKQLERLNIAKSEFVSFASHQLRSPLTVIRNYAAMIAEGSYGETNPKVKEIITIMMERSNDLLRMIKEYLDITKIELGEFSYSFNKIDFKKLLLALVEDFKSAKKHDFEGEIEVQINQGANYSIIADELKIKEVVSNLIDNAIKYTKKGQVRISLEPRASGDGVKVAVKDSGIGMTRDTIAKLFRKFSRAKDIGKTKIGGTGLGLYIAREMVVAHGGRIWAESPGEGKGSTFIIELPPKPPPQEENTDNNKTPEVK